MTQPEIPPVPPAADIASEGAGLGRNGRAKKSPAQPTFRNLAELLRAAYSGKRKRLHLNKADVSAITSAPHLDSATQDQLLSMADADRSLEVTLHLMLLASESFSVSPIRGLMRRFIHDVLSRHPVFSVRSLSGVLDNLPDAPGENRAIQILLQQNYVELLSLSGLPRQAKKVAQQCRDNALRCLLLWFHETRVTPIDWTHRQLAEAIWRPAGKSLKSDAQRIALLMQAREPAVLAVSYSVLEGKLNEFSAQAAQASRDADKANEKAVQLEGAVDGLQTTLEQVTRDFENLKREHDEQRKDYEGRLSHLRDDLETMRGQVLRRLSADVVLLVEGIHALRREPPKVHVMIDHAERVLDALKAQMTKLKEGG